MPCLLKEQQGGKRGRRGGQGDEGVKGQEGEQISWGLTVYFQKTLAMTVSEWNKGMNELKC